MRRFSFVELIIFTVIFLIAMAAYSFFIGLSPGDLWNIFTVSRLDTQTTDGEDLLRGGLFGLLGGFLSAWLAAFLATRADLRQRQKKLQGTIRDDLSRIGQKLSDAYDDFLGSRNAKNDFESVAANLQSGLTELAFFKHLKNEDEHSRKLHAIARNLDAFSAFAAFVRRVNESGSDKFKALQDAGESLNKEGVFKKINSLPDVLKEIDNLVSTKKNRVFTDQWMKDLMVQHSKCVQEITDINKNRADTKKHKQLEYEGDVPFLTRNELGRRRQSALS